METVVDYPLDDIIFDEKNPNVTSDSDENASKSFLKRHGILRTVIIDKKTKLCVDGEHICRRAIERGDKTISAIVESFKDEAEIAEVRSFLNYGPRGKPSEVKFAEQLKAIQDAGNLANFAESMGRSQDEFKRMLEESFPTLQSSPIPDEPKARSKPGEVYKCGPHYVMCGDACQPEDVELLILTADNKNPRLLLTDPPYDFGNTDWLQPYLEWELLEILVLNSDKPTADMLEKYNEFFVGFYVITFNSPSRFANQPMISHRLISHYRKGRSNFQNLHDAFGTVHELVLSKSGLTRHEKPLDLPRKFIVHYTKPEEVVLDIFAGSGSTMIACEQLGRVCYSIEKDPHKVDIILKRYEDFNHDKAVKVS